MRSKLVIGGLGVRGGNRFGTETGSCAPRHGRKSSSLVGPTKTECCSCLADKLRSAHLAQQMHDERCLVNGAPVSLRHLMVRITTLLRSGVVSAVARSTTPSAVTTITGLPL